MKIFFEQLPRGFSTRTLIRRCGYAEHISREVSYSKRFGSHDFPRFHVYIEEKTGKPVCFNLHLDQKAVTYEGNHAHSGEYEGQVLEIEANRIKHVISTQENEDDD